MDRFRLFRGGEGQGTVALLGFTFEIQGSDIVYSAEVRVARLLHCGITFGIQGTDIVFPAEVRIMRSLHCWDCIWNPGFEHRVFRGGEDQEIVALRDYVCNPGFGFRLFRGGEDQEIVALRDYVWNPGQT